MKKKCKKCGKILIVDNFYTHPKMADGHLNICKECVKKRINKYRKDNIDKIIMYDRERRRTDEAKQKRRERQEELRKLNPEEFRRNKTEAQRKSRAKQKLKTNARANLANAIIRGEIIKPTKCDNCGRKGYLEAHHEDYSKQLDVLWLCRNCHGIKHRKKDI